MITILLFIIALPIILYLVYMAGLLIFGFIAMILVKLFASKKDEDYMNPK